MVKHFDTGLVCIHFGADSLLKALLKSLSKEWQKEMVVVAHNPFLPELEGFPGTLIHDPSNPGYATAFGREAERLKSLGKRVVVGLNSDLTLEKGALEHLLEMRESYGLAAASGALLDRSGKILSGPTFARPPFFHPENPMRNLPYGCLDVMDEVSPTGFVCGAFFCLDLKCSPGMNPDFFLYFEDIEMGLRLLENSYRIGFVPGARAVHLESGASGGGMTARGVRYRLGGLKTLLRLRKSGMIQKILAFGWHGLRLFALWIKGGMKI